jgi:hypothetical protein
MSRRQSAKAKFAHEQRIAQEYYRMPVFIGKATCFSIQTGSLRRHYPGVGAVFISSL